MRFTLSVRNQGKALQLGMFRKRKEKTKLILIMSEINSIMNSQDQVNAYPAHLSTLKGICEQPQFIRSWWGFLNPNTESRASTSRTRPEASPPESNKFTRKAGLLFPIGTAVQADRVFKRKRNQSIFFCFQEENGMAAWDSEVLLLRMRGSREEWKVATESPMTKFLKSMKWLISP